MLRSILFGPWKDEDETPELCPLCKDHHPIFEYRLTGPDRTAEQGYERQGYCCLRCGQQLLATLEELTLAQWAEEGEREEQVQDRQSNKL
jgi:hypothetical protein